MDRNLGALVGFLVTALALAGCTAPAAEPAQAPPPQDSARASDGGAAVPMPAVPLPGALDAPSGLPADEEVPPCPVQQQRSAEARLDDVVLTVEGCIALNEPLQLGGVPRDPRIDFDVVPGTEAIRVQYHLHGPEALRFRLRDPLGAVLAEQGADGGRGTDSFVVAEVLDPLPGEWRVEVEVQELTAARAWTTVVVLAGAA